MHEKRAYSRIEFCTDATCTTEGGATVVGRTRDLSVGGAYVESQEIPAFGSKVTLNIAVPEHGALQLQGIVRWTKPDGFGIQFQLLGAKETYVIAKLTRLMHK